RNVTGVQTCALPILFLKCSGMAQDKDIPNTSATTIALMEHFETVDDLANADLEELTAFVTETGHGRFTDPAVVAKAVQAAARGRSEERRVGRAGGAA